MPLQAGEAENARAWNWEDRHGAALLRDAAESRKATGRRDRVIDAIVAVKWKCGEVSLRELQ